MQENHEAEGEKALYHLRVPQALLLATMRRRKHQHEVEEVEEVEVVEVGEPVHVLDFSMAS